MRSFASAPLLLSFVLLIGVPTPARAWWGWLDNLSGPGPFAGAEFDFTIACFMDQPTPLSATLAQRSMDTLTTALFDRAKVDFTDATQKQDVETLRTQVKDLVGMLDLSKVSDDAARKDSGNLARKVDDGFRSLLKKASSPALAQAQAAVDSLERAWRGYRVPKVSKPKIVLGLFGSCFDRLRHEDADGLLGNVRHEDRNPVMSIVLNYRELANRTPNPFLLLSHETRPGTSGFAAPELISLRIFGAKLSFPLSGRFDVVNAQTGAGVYWFRSSGFKNGDFTGFVYEPLRFDFHLPGILIDWANRAEGKGDRFLRRLPLSVSYSAGVMLFPAGFSADRFVGTMPDDVGREISGGEAIFEMGLVINVGRLFGK
jgi:hypothetical protein